MDGLLCKEIDDWCATFECRQSVIVIPCCTIKYELLKAVERSIEYSSSAMKSVIVTLTECLARRLAIEPQATGIHYDENKLNEKTVWVAQKMASITGIPFVYDNNTKNILFKL